MIFPLLISFLNKFGIRNWVFFVVVYIGSLLSIHALAASDGFKMDIGDFSFRCVLNQMPVFLLGVTAAHIRSGYISRVTPVTDLVALSGFLLISLAIWNSDYSVTKSVLPIVVGLAFVFLMFFMSRIYDQIYERYLTLICLVGKISFSMYIWHFLIIHIIRETLPDQWYAGKDLILFTLYLLAVLTTACISYYTEKIIEGNGIRFGKWVVKKL